MGQKGAVENPKTKKMDKWGPLSARLQGGSMDLAGAAAGAGAAFAAAGAAGFSSSESPREMTCGESDLRCSEGNFYGRLKKKGTSKVDYVGFIF